MKVVFISGKYRGATWDEIDRNIQTAKAAAIRLWQQGYAVLCPHMNTAHFDGLADDLVWLRGDMEMLRRCDAVYFLVNWQDSEGARAEHETAAKLGLELMYEHA